MDAQGRQQTPDRLGARSGPGWGPHRAFCWLAWAALGFSGCATWWDDVTSRDHKFGSAFTTKKEDPLKVLEESTDGDKRARAFRALQEPKQNGGTQQEQDFVVKILTTAATMEQQSLCRIAAVCALRNFHDPRAVEALKEAYYRASNLPLDAAAVLKLQVLNSLGETGNPAAVEMLVRVLREPPVEGSEGEKQQKLDERIAAARALGHFRDPQAAKALIEVLNKEKDVALRRRANDALVAATGKDLPPDAQKWQDYLEKKPIQGTEAVHDPGAVQKLLGPILPADWRP